jgi:hypothetical protein
VDLKVVPASERSPFGYYPLAHTHDDNTKAFSHKVLTIKVDHPEQTTRAVTDLQILSATRKEDVPTGFTRLPDINGFSICYKVGDVGKKKTPQLIAQPAVVKCGTREFDKYIRLILFFICPDPQPDNLL